MVSDVEIDRLLAGWRAGANNEPLQPFLGVAWCLGWQQQRASVAAKTMAPGARAEVDKLIAQLANLCGAIAGHGEVATDLARAAVEIALANSHADGAAVAKIFQHTIEDLGCTTAPSN